MSVIKGLVAICGGIGSGKSVVSEVLRIMGYPVYDCDSRAKMIMDCDAGIHSRLCADIHPDAVVDGKINRPLISEVVFSDNEALLRLNGIVHAAVTADLKNWCVDMRGAGHERMFVETALLRQSGLIEIVEDIWEITAPIYIRIERVKKRSGLSEEQILARINSQQSESMDEIPHKTIKNDSTAPILPQIHALIDERDNGLAKD